MEIQHALSSEQTIQAIVSDSHSWRVHKATSKSKMESNAHGYMELQKEVGLIVIEVLMHLSYKSP